MGGELILLHGFTQTGASWEPVRREVGERYRSHAPDLRGHGTASGRWPVTFEAVIEDIASLVDGPFVLVGYSMGGRIALALALARPQRVERLVLVSASPGLADPGEREARRRADEALAGEIERSTLVTFARRWGAQPLFAGQPPEVARRAHEDRLRNTPAGLAGALRGLGTGAMKPLWNRLADFGMPVDLVVGGRDEKFRGLNERMAERMGNARLHVIAGAGHAVHLEDPKAVAQVILDEQSGCTVSGRGVLAIPLPLPAVADLQPYIDRVLDAQDRVLLEEASSCLETGARRAAYITLWLATAESLRRKFLDAATFDTQAGQIVSQIRQREAAHKAIDGLLIEKAKEYGFVSDSEATRLKHLYENRNVYGHPYAQSPGNEAVVAAAADAVEIVLGRPVALRHGYLDRQATRLTSDMAFLSDDKQAVEQYAHIVHGRSAPDLRLWFVRKMLTKLDGVFSDPSSDLLQRRAVWFLRRFLLADTTIFDGWEPAEDLADHPAVLPELLAVEELFELLLDHPKDVVVNSLEHAASTDPTNLELLWSLREAGALTGRHQDQLASLLANTPLTGLTGSGLPLCAYWTRVVQGLSSHTWGTQNEAISVLRLAGARQAAQLEPSAQEELGRNIMQAAEGTAWRAVNLLGELASAEPPWPPGLIKGAALEPFLAVDGHIRLKPGEMLRALRALRVVAPVEWDEVISHICHGLRAGTVRDPFHFRHQRPEALQAIDTAAQEGGLQRLSEIASAIKAIEIPPDV